MTRTDKLERRLFSRIVFFAAAFVFFMNMSAGLSGVFEQEAGSSAGSPIGGIGKSIGSSAGGDSNSGRLEVSLQNSIAPGAGLIRYDDANRIKEKFKKGLVSFFGEEDTFARTGTGGQPVAVVFTDSSYPLFFETSLTDGVFFSEEAFAKGLNTAIISRDLAGRLFGTYKAVGNEITLFDSKYTVIGVYERSRSFLSFLGSETTERVFVPFTSGASFRGRPVRTVSVREERFEGDNFRKYELDRILREELAINLDAYKINDFYNADEVTSQLRHLLVFFIGIACIVFFAGLFKGFAVKKYGTMKRALKDMYFFQFLKYRTRETAEAALAALAFAGAVAGVAILINFRPGIPPEYIPAENIFDLKFYAEVVKASIQSANSSYGYIPSAFERSVGNASAAQWFLILCAAAALWMVMQSTGDAVSFCKCSPVRTTFVKKAKVYNTSLPNARPDGQCIVLTDWLPIAFCAGTVMSMAASLACRLPLAFPLKELAVAALFMALYFLRIFRAAEENAAGDGNTALV